MAGTPPVLARKAVLAATILAAMMLVSGCSSGRSSVNPLTQAESPAQGSVVEPQTKDQQQNKPQQNAVDPVDVYFVAITGDPKALQTTKHSPTRAVRRRSYSSVTYTLKAMEFPKTTYRP